MFKTHLIQKGEVRIPPIRPEPRPAGIRPAEEGDKKSKVNKNVDKGSPEMVADHFRHHPEDREKMWSNASSNEHKLHTQLAQMDRKEQAQKAMTAGATSTTGSAMMHPVADGAEQQPGDMDKANPDAVRRRPERMSMTSRHTGAGYPDRSLPQENERNEGSPSRNPLRPFKKARYPEDSEDTEEDREEDEAGHVKETKHRAKSEEEEEDEDVEKSTPLDWSESERRLQHKTGKDYHTRNSVAAEASKPRTGGIGTETRGNVEKAGMGKFLRNLKPKDQTRYAASTARNREMGKRIEAETKRVVGQRSIDRENTAGMRHLHKSMETVIKGLNSIITKAGKKQWPSDSSASRHGIAHPYDASTSAFNNRAGTRPNSALIGPKTRRENAVPTQTLRAIGGNTSRRDKEPGLRHQESTK